jgi:hypothetical protein
LDGDVSATVFGTLPMRRQPQFALSVRVNPVHPDESVAPASSTAAWRHKERHRRGSVTPASRRKQHSPRADRRLHLLVQRGSE